jgi:hypothetical protein
LNFVAYQGSTEERRKHRSQGRCAAAGGQRQDAIESLRRSRCPWHCFPCRWKNFSFPVKMTEGVMVLRNEPGHSVTEEGMALRNEPGHSVADSPRFFLGLVGQGPSLDVVTRLIGSRNGGAIFHRAKIVGWVPTPGRMPKKDEIATPPSSGTSRYLPILLPFFPLAPASVCLSIFLPPPCTWKACAPPRRRRYPCARPLPY